MGIFIPLCALPFFWGACRVVIYTSTWASVFLITAMGFLRPRSIDETEYRFPRFLFLCFDILIVLISLWGNRGR